ncbi:hypothetical protein THAOC_22944 [Thalassiosira oceanica]|uniref:Sel1 repeat family protein n=1 Tax=Thalassiosira oceanica TaxID=159749 RepID=K0S837_THAOC|nr:hypothetical protein THAOC_22944 [Thalassiosira oceanica]|eukprot:EJK57056.1 hypothetical protein THAOC_22944 [Thalassiosira oceanica]
MVEWTAKDMRRAVELWTLAAEVGSIAALYSLGNAYDYGKGVQQDMTTSVEFFTKAAMQGHAESRKEHYSPPARGGRRGSLRMLDAHFDLGNAYRQGHGVQQDNAKGAEFYTKAAMQGHAESRYNLGYIEALRGNHNRAVRHWLITAKMGDKPSLEAIKNTFKAGFATKEQYAEALKGYQDAVEKMKSHDRDEAKAIREQIKAG